MRYVRVRWVHQFEDSPIDLYSEVDDQSQEVRKVEVFANGLMQFADQEQQTGDTWLGDEPFPTIEEIAEDPQFLPAMIDRDEFERVWKIAHQSSRSLV